MRLDMPTRETPRLLLRALEEGDACDLFQTYHDEQVVRYLTFPQHHDVDQTLYTLRTFFLPFVRRGEPQTWAVVWKQRDCVIGTLGFHTLNEDCAQVGYALQREYWNMGIMKEALRELIDVGFRHMELRRMEALYETGHIASQALLAACGFKEEGCLRSYTKLSDGAYHDMKIASLLYDEWKG